MPRRAHKQRERERGEREQERKKERKKERESQREDVKPITINHLIRCSILPIKIPGPAIDQLGHDYKQNEPTQHNALS